MDPQRVNMLSHLTKRPPVDIEFQDLSLSVPQGRKGTKLILRSVNGKFRSGHLNAIVGPSGAGKSTLLNILAGYKCREATGSILINGKPRNLKQFRNMSRYIMQEDLIQPLLTVQEAMMMAANLKLNKHITKETKLSTIAEILELLRLGKIINTPTERLSGGERKRLVVALELINNPPVLFLDEPTTGLDDLSCSQTISLLKMLAEGGRTVICSIHSPSARIFGTFDNVFVVAYGQCVYQGLGLNVVPFLSSLGLDCPKHYNPADFLMEVCCQEYGNFQDKLVSAIENGKNSKYCKGYTEDTLNEEKPVIEIDQNEESHYKHEEFRWFNQFKILILRMWLQMWRDKCYLLLRVVLHIFIGILIGNLYLGMGQDGSKTIFNFGFYFTCLIFFMYIPMMPILLQFPKEIQLLKREHFNKWYCLSAYFSALSVSTMPIHVILGSLYLTIVYFLSDQPLELDRMALFYLICILTGIISESFGLLISSTLSIVNGMFVGPVALVPFMLLAVYGFGSGIEGIPRLIRIAMYFSYLRYSLEALIHTMLTDRPKLACPETEDHCIFTDLNVFVRQMGMENTIFWVDLVSLIGFLVMFRGLSYYLLRQRLTPNKTFVALQYVGRFIKSQLGIAR